MGWAVGEDLLDRGGEDHVVAVVAEALGDGAGVAAPANDRGAREPLADPALVHRGPRRPDQDAWAAKSRLAGDHVENLHVERRDLRTADDRQPSAAHSRPNLGQRHDRIGRDRDRGRGREHEASNEERAAEQVRAA
jgi:hypothetical protein